MIRWVRSLFYKDPQDDLISRIYAVVTGKYAGEMLVFIKADGTDQCFLSVPKLINRRIPREKFDFAVSEGIVEFVEKAPKKEFKVIRKQYEKNEIDSRRK